MWWIRRKGKKNIIEEIPDYVELSSVENGYGFYGTLIYDPYEDTIQCHVCGEWFKSLGRHLKIHNIIAKNYKDEFALTTSMGLCVLNISENARQNAIDTGLYSKIKNKSPSMSEFSKRIRETPETERQKFVRSQMTNKMQQLPDAKENNRQKALKRFQDPKQRQQQKELLNRIRPDNTGLKHPPRSEEFRKRASNAAIKRFQNPEYLQAHKNSLLKRDRNKREETNSKYLSLIGQYDKITIEQISIHFQCHPNSCRPIIKRLLKAKKIKRFGTSRQYFYCLFNTT